LNQLEHDTIVDGAADARDTLLLAHGAGGPMDSPFLARIARGLAEHCIRVVRFEFPYMASRRTENRRGAPDREPVLRARWLEMVERFGGGPRVVVGGKSLGGRIASMIADEARVRGLVCFGYPFHPPGDRERLRTKHLEPLATPALILQGTRDPFGTREDVEGYRLSPSIRVEWLEGGDHSFKPPAGSGKTEAQHVSAAIDAAAAFIRALPAA